jgi:2-C-methyl-D-erythritol 4-phosphate cytidylyltransferase
MARTPTSRHGDYPDATGAIIVAAGRSLRMGGLDKVMSPLLGKPLVLYSLQAVNDSPGVSEVVLVVSTDNLEVCRRLVKERGLHKVIDVRVGGDRRQDSVRIGLDGMPDPGSTIVHDGARPCVDAATISRGIDAVHRHGAAIAAVPVKDTIKSAARDRRVVETIDRDGLWAAQTPQVFRTSVLKDAHGELAGDFTDDAAMVEARGGTVTLFMGSYDNIKVTTPEDVAVAEVILARRTASPVGRSA